MVRARGQLEEYGGKTVSSNKTNNTAQQEANSSSPWWCQSQQLKLVTVNTGDMHHWTRGWKNLIGSAITDGNSCETKLHLYWKEHLYQKSSLHSSGIFYFSGSCSSQHSALLSHFSRDVSLNPGKASSLNLVSGLPFVEWALTQEHWFVNRVYLFAVNTNNLPVVTLNFAWTDFKCCSFLFATAWLHSWGRRVMKVVGALVAIWILVALDGVQSGKEWIYEC